MYFFQVSLDNSLERFEVISLFDDVQDAFPAMSHNMPVIDD